MKTVLRVVLYQSFALFLTAQMLPGLRILGGWTTYVLGGILLSILSFALKPLLQLIAFPLNLLTFGLFNCVINAILLWVLTVLVAKIDVHIFSIPGVSFLGMTIPNIHIYSIIPAYIVIAVVLSAVTWILTWITK
jgi:putative membrane protein